MGPSEAFAPLPCEGLSLLEVPYSSVKLLINDSNARIFPVTVQHQDGADSKTPEHGRIYYNGESGNCLAGFIRFNQSSAEIELRSANGICCEDSSVLRWCKRLMANRYLNQFKLSKLTVGSRHIAL